MGKLRHGSPGVTTRPGNKATPPLYPQDPTGIPGCSHLEKNPPVMPKMGGIHGKGGGMEPPGGRRGEGRVKGASGGAGEAAGAPCQLYPEKGK